MNKTMTDNAKEALEFIRTYSCMNEEWQGYNDTYFKSCVNIIEQTLIRAESPQVDVEGFMQCISDAHSGNSVEAMWIYDALKRKGYLTQPPAPIEGLGEAIDDAVVTVRNESPRISFDTIEQLNAFAKAATAYHKLTGGK